MTNFIKWTGVLGFEDVATGDGRLIMRNALRWENLPIPLRYVEEDVGAHDRAVVIGRIDEITREGTKIMGAGVIDTDTQAGERAATLIKENMSRGVSLDLDDVVYEINTYDEEGNEAEEDSEEAAQYETTILSALVRAATAVAIPAFPGALLEIEEDSQVTEEEDPFLVASAIPTKPPVEWFADPELKEPTGVTITPEGRVFGHLATFDVCHVGIDGGCTTAPHSISNYSYFRTGATECADGTLVATGNLTMDTGHAGPKLNNHAAAAHYDNTGAAVADVTIGEDKFGIWFAGALRPGVSAQQIRALRGSSLSGDWRLVAGNLELVAALAVNVPGFPIPRTSMLVSSGEQRSLVAAGVIKHTTDKDNGLEILGRKLKREKLARKVYNGMQLRKS